MNDKSTDGADCAPETVPACELRRARIEVEALDKVRAQMAGEIERLRAALKVAKKTIRAMHGWGEAKDAALDRAWNLYQQSPEMRAINAALRGEEGAGG